MLNVLDEFTQKCIVILIVRKLKSIDVIDCCPPVFIATVVQEWFVSVGAKTSSVALGPPCGKTHRQSIPRFN
jgi:hypothetical protein